MANPNPTAGILRPPIINISTDVEQNRVTQETITRICAEQCRIAIREYLNPSAEIAGSDQTIEARYANNLTDLDKVPDVVRSLREFSGNPSEYSS